MKKQVNKKNYDFARYVREDRFMSYYYQLKFIYKSKPKNILEIGIGNNFLKKLLSNEFEYKTLDLAKDLNPDILGSVDNIPLKKNSFDLVCAFQILEHLPFNLFEKSLKELARVSKENVLISLPYSNISYKINLKVPFLLEVKFSLTIPKFLKKHKFNGEHYWEIGAKGYSLKRIKKIISKHLKIKKVFNPYENKYHIFFILEKIKKVV